MPFSSFSSALTGLNNNAQAINLTSNNLANLNTTAFKSGRISFAELVGAVNGTSDNGNPIQPGLGSMISGITQINTQGSIQSTGRTTDAAISGNGLFVVDTGGGNGYTRCGNFSFSPTGELLTTDGFKVLGYLYDATKGKVDTAAALSPIVVQKGSSLPPKATEKVSVNANLDSRVDSADTTNNTFATGVQVVDSLGSSHLVTVTYTKTGNGTWTWDASVPAADTAGGLKTDPPVSVGSGSVTFGSDGVLTDPPVSAGYTNPTLSITNLANGAADMDIEFAIRDTSNNPPSPNVTGFAADSNVSSTSQDGYQSSALKDISIGADGTVAGVYENGKVLALAKIALATFPNSDGLAKLGGSTFVASGGAGEPTIGTAGSGGRGSLTGSALEGSNVDIAQEFTNLIIAQRGYQASSRVITATDQMLQETVNLVR